MNKPFSSNEFAQRFCVCDPKKAHKNDHIVYTLIGEDKHGPFQILRRYKEFNLLRQVLFERFSGFYVPPIPSKRKMVCQIFSNNYLFYRITPNKNLLKIDAFT